MAVWPTTLPQAVADSGYSETPPESAHRTPMDKGPAKVRRKSTTEVRPFRCVILDLTSTQTSYLDTFYLSTTSGGALPFDFPHPRLGTVSVRFVSAPVYSPVAGGAAWDAALSLEILP